MNYKHLASAAFFASGLVAASAQAQNISNGSLTGPIGNERPPPGWFIAGNQTPSVPGPDTMDANSNLGIPGLQSFAAAPSASPDGGTWVGLGADGTFFNAISQSMTGLLVGQSYVVSWYSANFGYTGGGGFAGSNAVEMRVNNGQQTIGSLRAAGPSWIQESAFFVATAPTMGLFFFPNRTTRSFISIDGIQVTAVPEPASPLLWAAGAAVVLTIARRRRPD